MRVFILTAWSARQFKIPRKLQVFMGGEQSQTVTVVRRMFIDREQAVEEKGRMN